MATGSASVTAGHQAYGRALVGMESPRVTVETHLAGGLPGFTVVGLPETAVREARDRVKSALQNCGFGFPQGKVVVNLAPAELAKDGARFDLAMAVSILRATHRVPPADHGLEFLGELGLFGELRRTRGCLCAALALAREDPGGTTRLVVPAANAEELATGPRRRLLAADHLQDVVRFLCQPVDHPLPAPDTPAPQTAATMPDLDDVVGQHGAKRALAIAAAGGHHLLLIGPPGTGKTMLARRLPALLPELGPDQAMEVAATHSAAALPPPPAGRPPFRSPHHSASAPAMAGGGRQALPGEISLAHRGVLFLDELPHFKPSVLDLLREPLETREIGIARAGYRATFPASFQLVAAMNPCPAGLTCEDGRCRCAPQQVRRYQARISGPLLDRIDLHVAVPPVPPGLMMRGCAAGDGPATGRVLQAAVADAQRCQKQRQGCLNCELAGSAVLPAARLDTDGRLLLERASERYELTARGTHRVLRTARTIADIAGEERVSRAHLSEALSYRALDWSGGV